MVCVPRPTSVPAAGDCLSVMSLVAVQLSLTVTPPSTFGTAASQLPSALASGVAEQSTLGSVVSVTVKVVLQVLVLPARSTAVTVIVCTPRPTSVPAAGDWLSVMSLVAVQLSLTVTPPSTLGTAAWQLPSASASGVAEQSTLGSVVSITVKVVLQVLVLPV